MKKILSVIILLLALACEARAEKLYFYTGKQYGYEYLFNPVNLILNGGFDILQCRHDKDLDIFTIPYTVGLRNVLKNLGNTKKSVGVGGQSAFITQEVFPLTFSEKASWWPNYQLHFWAGAVTFTYLHDYFAYNGYDYPDFYAALAYWAFHFTNEIVENNWKRYYSCDSVADIYIFDIAGMLLGLSEKARHFFAKTLNMADWSMQPVFLGDDKHLENNGEYYSLKYLLPFGDNKNWHLFYYWGLNFVLGLAYKFENGYALSFGAGIRTKTIRVMNKKTSKETITYVYTGGIFLDKNNSLLASFIVNVNYYEILQINIYPGIFPGKQVSPGIFLSISENFDLMFGLIFNYTFSETIFREKMYLVKRSRLQKYGIEDL